MILKYIVNSNNLTINQILKNELNISSRLCYKLIQKKCIYLNNISVDTRLIANLDDILSIDLSYTEDNSNIVSTKMELDIIYEDETMIIINKPSGIATHPSVLHFSDSISNGIKYYFDSIKLYKKIRPINRLDLNTAGLLIFAKNEYIQEYLIRQMKTNTFKKEYLALIHGHLDAKNGIINKPIGRKENSIIERCIDKNGKNAITHFEVIEELKNCSLVNCKLETGRTHQIRVHFASIGHSLIGDTLYGNMSDSYNKQALLCYKLSFIHPLNKKRMDFFINNPKNYFKTNYSIFFDNIE